MVVPAMIRAHGHRSRSTLVAGPEETLLPKVLAGPHESSPPDIRTRRHAMRRAAGSIQLVCVAPILKRNKMGKAQ